MNAQSHAGEPCGARLQEVVLALALVTALIGCDRLAEPPPAAPMTATVPTGRTEDVTLRRFECDERCWLEVELPDSSVVAGWCNAPVCAQWLDNGTRLPAELVGRRARIVLRQQKVFIGTEEDRMEADEVRGITLLSRE